MRDFAGNVNTNLKAQRSYQFIVGGDYQFTSWGRPFKLLVETYYKKIENVVPYDIDNVRIRYYARNDAEAYAYGLDTRINGEFIKGVDSWFSLGLLNARENLFFDNKGYIQRPSNQWMTISMYFQDEMPHNPTFKAHINMVYGTGLPFGPPRNVDQRNVFNAPAYRRVDLGLSKMILFKSIEERKKRVSAESIWLSVEIYNVLATNNVVSYLWIKDIFNTQFAVPNFLSQRMLNVRGIVRF
jgi:outer membrane receptor protein involved in Fe transport